MFLDFIWSILGRIVFFTGAIGTKNSFPKPLSKEEEERYLSLAANGDVSAKEILVKHNMRLVAHIVKKYYTNASNQDDLISIGTIGLIKAVSTFKSDKNIRLATYASRCIENEILMFFRSQKKNSNEVSINDTIDMDKDGNPLTYLDIIGVDDSIVDNVEMKIYIDRIRELVDSVLDERERRIITLRYGLKGFQPRTQREVAKHLGISRSYVSRIEKRALEALKDSFGNVKPDFDA
jgi:RNA polymerase sporulation-specific sigma factor